MTSRRQILATAILTPLVSWGTAQAADPPEALALLQAKGAQLRKNAAGAVTAITFPKSEELTDAEYDCLASLQSLTALTFYGKCLMTDVQAAKIARCSGLTELAANATRLTDAGFAALAPLKELRKLTLWHLGWETPKEDRLTGKGFGALAELPRLEQLNFAGSTVTDEGLAALRAVKQLREVVLYHTWTSDAGMKHLSGLTGLRKVDVGPQFSMRIGDAGVADLATLPALEELKVQETILTYAGSLGRLKQCKALKKLILDRVDAQDAEIERLRNELPGVSVEWKRATPEESERMRRELERKMARGTGS